MIPVNLIDQLLLRAFRFRTRGFLRMEDADGTVPPQLIFICLRHFPEPHLLSWLRLYQN